MFLKSSRQEVDDFLARKISMLTLVHGMTKDYPCSIVTIHGEAVVNQKNTIMGSLPEIYLPSPTAFYEESLSPDYQE